VQINPFHYIGFVVQVLQCLQHHIVYKHTPVTTVRVCESMLLSKYYLFVYLC